MSEVTYDFNQIYFCKNLSKLRLLRAYLREHPDLDPCDLQDCTKLRIEGLKLTIKRKRYLDFSIGDYIKYFGGVEAFMKLPVYDHRISHIIPAVVYARKCNEEDGYANPIHSISISRSCEIICRLYEADVHYSDDRVSQLRKWCRRSPQHINEGLAMFDEELPPESEKNHEEIFYEVKQQLRFSLESICPTPVLDDPLIEELE